MEFRQEQEEGPLGFFESNGLGALMFQPPLLTEAASNARYHSVHDPKRSSSAGNRNSAPNDRSGQSSTHKMFLMVTEKVDAMEQARTILIRGGDPSL